MGLPAPLLPQNTCHHENDFISVLELATSMLLHCERAFPGFSLYIGFGLGCLASPDRGKSRCSLSCPCSSAGFCSGPRVGVLLRIYSRGHCFPVWSVQPWTACPGQRFLGWREQPRVQKPGHSCSGGHNFCLCMHNTCCCSINSSWSSAPVRVRKDLVFGRGATAV